MSFSNEPTRGSKAVDVVEPSRIHSPAAVQFARTVPLAPPLPPDGPEPRLVLSSSIWDTWQRTMWANVPQLQLAK